MRNKDWILLTNVHKLEGDDELTILEIHAHIAATPTAAFIAVVIAFDDIGVLDVDGEDSDEVDGVGEVEEVGEFDWVYCK